MDGKETDSFGNNIQNKKEMLKENIAWLKKDIKTEERYGHFDRAKIRKPHLKRAMKELEKLEHFSGNY